MYFWSCKTSYFHKIPTILNISEVGKSPIKTKKNGNKYFEFKSTDVIAVKHFLMWNNKKEAYILSRGQNIINANSKSINSLAQRYFDTEKIKLLLSTELQKFKDRIVLNVERYELKNLIQEDLPQFDPSKLEDIQDIDKSTAIKIVEKIINDNKTDSKTIKELVPQLIKLKAWDKERPENDTNIVQYELPKRTKNHILTS